MATGYKFFHERVSAVVLSKLVAIDKSIADFFCGTKSCADNVKHDIKMKAQII